MYHRDSQNLKCFSNLETNMETTAFRFVLQIINPKPQTLNPKPLRFDLCCRRRAGREGGRRSTSVSLPSRPWLLSGMLRCVCVCVCERARARPWLLSGMLRCVL